MVSKDSLKTYQLPKRAEIQSIAKQAYDSLTARSVSKSLETPVQRQQRIAQSDEQFQQMATQLSNMILAPAATTLNRKRIVIVADGVLQYIPFAALTNPNAAVAEPLVVQHELITLPSASSLAIQRRNLRGRKLAPQILAVLADPVFTTNDPRLAKTTSPVRQDVVPAPADSRRIEHTTAPMGQLSIRRLPFTRDEADQILAVMPAATELEGRRFSRQSIFCHERRVK